MREHLAEVIVAVVIVTLICRALRAPDGVDATSPDDYTIDSDTQTPPPLLAKNQLPDPVPAS
jgi:hypothetical protein